MDKFKLIITAFFAAVSARLGILAVPVYILVISNIMDYITGLFAARYRGEKISSYTGIRGITKKVCMWLLICVGALLDKLTAYATSALGLDLEAGFIIGALVAVWLICNEIISILENISDIGLTPPPLITIILSKIKEKIEKKH